MRSEEQTSNSCCDDVSFESSSGCGTEGSVSVVEQKVVGLISIGYK